MTPPNQTVLLGREIEVSREELSNAKREMNILVQSKTNTHETDSDDVTMASTDQPAPPTERLLMEQESEGSDSSDNEHSKNEPTALEFQTPQETPETPNSSRRPCLAREEMRAERTNRRSSSWLSNMHEAAASPINPTKVVKATINTPNKEKDRETRLARLLELSSGATPRQRQTLSPQAHLSEGEPEDVSEDEPNNSSESENLITEEASKEHTTMTPEQYETRNAQLSEIASRFRTAHDDHQTKTADEETGMKQDQASEKAEVSLIKAESINPKRGRGRPPKKVKNTAAAEKQPEVQIADNDQGPPKQLELPTHRRGRGRPPSKSNGSETLAVEQTMEQKMEDSKIPTVQTDVLTPRRGRGRPPTKNKGAHPAENTQAQVTENDNVLALQAETTPLRGRARPSKTGNEAAVAENPTPQQPGRALRSNRGPFAGPTPPRRGRGRPPKTITPHVKRNTRSTTATAATPTKTGGEWEVEMIQGSRICGETHRHFYEVKWKGFPISENTWEPKRNLLHCKEAIEEYEKRARQRN